MPVDKDSPPGSWQRAMNAAPWHYKPVTIEAKDTTVYPHAATYNKDYQLLFRDKDHQELFVRAVTQLSALLKLNKEDSGSTLHDDMMVWFRNLFFLTEERFQEAFKEFENDLGLRARMWRIYNLCRGVNQASYVRGDVVDIGCYEAKSTKVFCNYNSDLFKGKGLYLFDLFDNPPAEAKKGNHGPHLADEVKTRMARYNPIVVPGDVTQTIPAHLPDEICFAHIDLNDAAAEAYVMPEVYLRMQPGAVMILDDYGFKRYRKSAEAHQNFLQNRAEKVLELPTGQGLLVKV